MSDWENSGRTMSCPIDKIKFPLPLVAGHEMKINDGRWVTIMENGVARDADDLRRKVRQWEQIDGPTQPVRKRDNP